MPSTRGEGIFEELKKSLTLRSIWQKVLVPQHDLLKSFGIPYHKAENSLKRFVSLLQLYNSFRTNDIEQKNSKEFNNLFKLCLEMISNNTETILN